MLLNYYTGVIQNPFPIHYYILLGDHAFSMSDKWCLVGVDINGLINGRGGCKIRR